MPRKLGRMWVVACLLCLTGLAYGQADFTTAQERKERQDLLMGKAQELLDSSDTHRRVALREEMLKNDTLKGVNGFAIDAFSHIYREGLKKKDDNARLQAVIGLSSINSPQMVAALTPMLSDPNPAIRLRVLKGIHDNGIIMAWPAVLSELKDPNIEVRTCAARTLGKLGQGGDQGQATRALIDLLTKTWKDLQAIPADKTEQRGDLNALIEATGTALAQLTQLPWRPGEQTKDLEAAVSVYTSWWNRGHLGGLKDPRLNERRKALDAIEPTADRSTINPLVEFMGQEHLRWQAAEDSAKSEHLVLLVQANRILNRVSGKTVALDGRSGDAQIVAAIKAWASWWQDEIKKVGA